MQDSRSFVGGSLKRAVAVCAIVAVFISAGRLIRTGVFNDAKTADKPDAVYEISRQLRDSFAIRNTTSQLIKKGMFRERFLWELTVS